MCLWLLWLLLQQTLYCCSHRPENSGSARLSEGPCWSISTSVGPSWSSSSEEADEELLRSWRSPNCSNKYTKIMELHLFKMHLVTQFCHFADKPLTAVVPRSVGEVGLGPRRICRSSFAFAREAIFSVVEGLAGFVWSFMVLFPCFSSWSVFATIASFFLFSFSSNSLRRINRNHCIIQKWGHIPISVQWEKTPTPCWIEWEWRTSMWEGRGD